uniref:5'-nucleotidase C-terminal domain-containing protein n=1 Tax=Desertifilum tharense IPPAS B-1220 TaxID=1781255 RepID=A0ACD5GPE9_9CYAN
MNPREVADPIVVEVVDAIADVVLEKDGNLFGQTEVFLEGRRSAVRTQETNLGNLTADANLFIAQQYDPTTVVSLKNGGGIRDNIGTALVPAGGTGEPVLLPPVANPLVNKAEGDISQLDIENALRFNNALSLVTVTAVGLKQIIEHGVGAAVQVQLPAVSRKLEGCLLASMRPNPQGREFAISLF